MKQIGQTEPKGYPKAYIGTPRGEVCSKHKAIIKKKFVQARISSIKSLICLVWCAHFATPGSF